MDCPNDPRDAANPESHRFFLLGFFLLFAFSMYDIVRHGTKFVDLPRLGGAGELWNDGVQRREKAADGVGLGELMASKEA